MSEDDARGLQNLSGHTMMSKDDIREMLKEWCPNYDERLGDTSNPDYIGPKCLEEAVVLVWQRIIEEREQCCRDVCQYCREGGEYGDACLVSFGWSHFSNYTSGFVPCEAAAIRERTHKT